MTRNRSPSPINAPAAATIRPSPLTASRKVREKTGRSSVVKMRTPQPQLTAAQRNWRRSCAAEAVNAMKSTLAAGMAQIGHQEGDRAHESRGGMALEFQVDHPPH